MTSSPSSPATIAIGGLLSLAAAMGIGRFVYTPILPFMTDGLSLTADAAGSIASANFLGYLVGALLGASKSLPGNQRAWFLGGLAASAASSAAMAATTAVWAFMAIRFASGVASAFVLVFSSALVLDRLRAAGHAGLSALHFAGVGCGIAFSAVLIAGLDRFGADWRQLWLASGTATLLLLALAARLVPSAPSRAAPASSVPPGARGGAMPASLARLILAYGLFGFGYVITATFVSVIARTTPALAATEAYVWLAVGLAAAPSILIWNRIALRTGARRAFALACVVEAAGVALTVSFVQPVLFLAGAALLGGTFMGITAIGLIEAQRQAAESGGPDPRRVLAVMTAAFGLGQVVGPWFAGQMHALTGSFGSASLAAACALLVAAVLAVR